jgi:GntR family transcriptional repressor for pyruvate dehydrogenase complex
MSEFIPVKTAKVTSVIVQQIKSAILNGTMRSGDKLPSERELAERFQVSRISIREALRSLESGGLLKIRHGAGVFVAKVDPRPMSDVLFSFLRMQNTSINELTEARTVLEPAIARLAAGKITEQELKRLEENVRATASLIGSDRDLASIRNIEFHAMIAEATHNAVISLTMQTLFNVLTEMTLEISDSEQRRQEISGSAVAAHNEILQALRERDPEKVYGLVLYTF